MPHLSPLTRVTSSGHSQLLQMPFFVSLTHTSPVFVVTLLLPEKVHSPYLSFSALQGSIRDLRAIAPT